MVWLLSNTRKPFSSITTHKKTLTREHTESTLEYSVHECKVTSELYLCIYNNYFNILHSQYPGYQVFQSTIGLVTSKHIS